MEYIGNVFRPPSEAYSLIIQVTVGCAHNTCTFCSMYKDDRFFIREQEEILGDLREMALPYRGIRRIFLADGDALVVPTNRLLEILHTAYDLYPKLERVTSYATAQDILRKSDEELQSLKEAGLDMVYVGLESGSDEVLREISKDMTQDDYVAAILKAKKAGIKTSVTMILGLGQLEKREDHIQGCIQAINRSQPDYVAFLSLHLSPGSPLYDEVKAGRFYEINDDEKMAEMREFIEQVDSPGTVFRSNHASNPVSIAGTLNRDREAMLAQIDQAVAYSAYRPNYWRNL